MVFYPKKAINSEFQTNIKDKRFFVSSQYNRLLIRLQVVPFWIVERAREPSAKKLERTSGGGPGERRSLLVYFSSLQSRRAVSANLSTNQNGTAGSLPTYVSCRLNFWQFVSFFGHLSVVS